MPKNSQTVHHDTKRCPECDSLGKIVDRTPHTYSLQKKKDRDARGTRTRTYECYECEARWKYYV